MFSPLMSLLRKLFQSELLLGHGPSSKILGRMIVCPRTKRILGVINEGLIHGTGAFSTILVQMLSRVNLSRGTKVHGEWSS